MNLIGEHTDYNDGFVCPMAIEPAVYLAMSPRDDRRLEARSAAFPDEPVGFDLAKEIENVGPDWGRYLRGTAHFLKEHVPDLRGVDLYVKADLPNGGGLSSSAALEVGTAVALLHAAGATLSGNKIAKVAQLAEQQFAGMPCGIMDQMAVATGKRDRAMLMDTRDLSKRFVRLDPGAVTVLIVNSMHAPPTHRQRVPDPPQAVRGGGRRSSAVRRCGT